MFPSADPPPLTPDAAGAPSEHVDPALAAVLTKAIAEEGVAVHTVTAAGNAADAGGTSPSGDDPGAAIAAAVGRTANDLIYGATDFGSSAAIAALMRSLFSMPSSAR